MWRKWKKGFAWLLTAMLVLGIIGGCGKASGDKAERALGQEQEIPVTVQDREALAEQKIWEEETGEEKVQESAEESGEREGRKETEESGEGENQQETEESDQGGDRENPEESDQGKDREYLDEDGAQIEEDGAYISKDEVALYLHIYGCLPGNYITKKEAQALGWDSKKGNLDEVAPGMSIGGSHFGNYEGMLPEKKGRKYYECDLEYEGGYRGAKRLIYSNDGLIFYTEDHYKTFEQLY